MDEKAVQRHFYHECQDRAQVGRVAACGYVKQTPPSFDVSRETCPECRVIATSGHTGGHVCPACGVTVFP